MQTFLASQDITVAVPLTRGGEPFVADGSSISWSLRGHNGIETSAAAALPCSDSVALIPVPAAKNAVAGTVEKRTLLVTGTVDGTPFQIRHTYRLTVFLNHALEPAAVRRFTGLDEGELPDADIDLTAAYLDVAAAVTTQVLADALGGAHDLEQAGNDAILAQAVLNLMPSMQARISKSESDGTSKVERFPIDLEKLERRARDMYATALTVMAPSTTVTPALIIFTTRTDPLTGA